MYASCYTATNGWSNATKIADDVLYDKVDRFVAELDNLGNVIVVWAHQVYKVGIDRADIWAVRYDVVNGWDKARAIEPGIEGRSENKSESAWPKIAFDSAGNAIVVWQQDQDTRNGRIWSNRYTVNVGWGEATPITRNDFDQNFPRIVMTAAGNAFVAWTQRSGIGVSVYTPAEGWCAPERIHAYSRGYCEGAPGITADAGGIVTVAWHNDGLIGVKTYIPGKGWGTATTLTRDANSQSPQLAITSNGIVHVIWKQGGRETNKAYFWTSHLLTKRKKL